MGFNYLQTDDRDDYFAQFGSKPKSHPVKSFSLINPQGEMIMKEVPMFKVRTYAKNLFLPKGISAKKIWRKLFESNGYKVINNYE